MPDGVADQHRIIVRHIFHTAGDGGPGVGIVHLYRGPAGGAAVVQIIGGIGGLRYDLVKVRVQGI